RRVTRTLRKLAEFDGQLLDDATLADHLDVVYADGLDEEFTREAERFWQEFGRICIEQLRAFESDPTLEEAFDRLFEATEVLPESLVTEYRELADRSVLEAQSLLVPLSDSQRRRLGTAAAWDPELNLWRVVVPYDPEAGLQRPGISAAGDR